MVPPFTLLTFIRIYSTKSKETSKWIFIHVFFAATTTLMFGVLFIHCLSCIYQVNCKCLNIPTADIAKMFLGQG